MVLQNITIFWLAIRQSQTMYHEAMSIIVMSLIHIQTTPDHVTNSQNKLPGVVF